MNIRITKPSIKSTGIFAVAMMAVLILLSSCSVRKAFHIFLDIPATQFINVNKATVTSKSICYAEVNEDQAGSIFASPSTLSVDAGILILGHLLSQLLALGNDHPVPVSPGYSTWHLFVRPLAVFKGVFIHP